MRLLILLILGGWITTCNSRVHNKNEQLINQANELSEQNPDSALVLLGAIDTSELQTAQYAGFVLVKVQAKDHANQSIIADTAIFAVRDWFIAAKDNPKAALACFYSGKVHHLAGAYKQAIINYLKAYELSKPLSDETMKARIAYYAGVANYQQHEYDEVLPYLEEAAQRYHRANKLSQEAHTNITLGNTYLLKNLPDSALVAYSRAMRYAENNQDAAIQSLFFQGVGTLVHWAGNHAEAERLYRQAIALSSNTNNRARLQSRLAQVFFENNQLDSAFIYAATASKTLESIDDRPALLSLYRLISLVYTRTGETNQAGLFLAKYDTCLNRIYKDKETQNILEIQKKYQVERLQDERIIERKNYTIAVLCLALALTALICVAIYFARRNKIKEKANAGLLQQINRMLALKDDAEDLKKHLETQFREKADEAVVLEANLKAVQAKIIQLEKTTGREKDALEHDLQKQKELVQKLNKMKEIHNKETSAIMAQYIKVLTKIDRFSSEINREDATNQQNTGVKKELLQKLTSLIYGQDQADYWAAVSAMLPKGMIGKIKKKFPDLTPNETRILCFNYLTTDPADIAVIMDITVATVYEYNNKLRKKLGIKTQVKIKDFLDSIL